MAGERLLRPSMQAVARSRTQCPQLCRSFTSTPRTRRIGRSGAQGSARNSVSRQLSREQSVQSRMSKAKGSEMPNDLGRFPETLIKPLSKDLPSFFSSQYKKRLQIELRAIWQKGRDFIFAVYQTKWDVKKDPITRKRIKEQLHLAERYSIARELHRKLYTALAQGDQATINDIACTGLQRALKTRLDQRRANNSPPESWSIQYTGWTPKSEKPFWLLSALIPPRFKSTQIMADRFGQIPIGRSGRLRQVMVRIRSEQTLDKHDGHGPQSRKLDEYVVIQKMKIDGVEDKWMIWGTTRASTSKEIDNLLSGSNSEGSLMERASTQMTMGGGL